MWRVEANKMNKHCEHPTRNGLPDWSFDEAKKLPRYKFCYSYGRTWGKCGEMRSTCNKKSWASGEQNLGDLDIERE
jgi:hypothetical protein